MNIQKIFNLTYFLGLLVVIFLISFFLFNSKTVTPPNSVSYDGSYSTPDYKFSGFPNNNIVIEDNHEILTVYYYKYSKDQDFLRVTIEPKLNQPVADRVNERKAVIMEDTHTQQSTLNISEELIGSEKASTISYTSEDSSSYYLKEYFLEHNEQIYTLYLHALSKHNESILILKNIIENFEFNN